MKIKDIGKVVTGKTPPTSHPEYYGGKYMFVTPNELHGGYSVSSTERTITESGIKTISGSIIDGTSVLVGCIGWDMGNVAMSFEKCATNQQINSITMIKDCVNPYYLYYWLSTKKEYLFSIASVTRTPILSKGVFEEVDIPIPSRTLQDKIVDALLPIDRMIENNNSLCLNLEAMAKLLYDYWFMQYDFPDENGNPYKSSGGKMVWNAELKKEIPEGWNTGSVLNNPLTTIIKPGVDQFERKVYLPTANVIGEFITEGSSITFENRESRANMQPTQYSVWFAKMKNSNKHITVPENSEWFIQKYILSTGFQGLQCSDTSIGYIHCFVNSEYFEKHKDTVAHGATQESVNEEDLHCIKMVIPPIHILKSFSKIVNPILKMKFKCMNESQQLVSIRSFLLPMLINGQVHVQEKAV